MDRNDEERQSGFESLGDATGMERRDERAPMRPGRDVSDAEEEEEATGDEKTAVEGASGMAATQASWGAMPSGIEGGAGTDVPAENDERIDQAPDERKDSSDPRGY